MDALTRRGGRHRNIERELTACDLYTKQGFSLRQIGNMLGCTQRAVLQFLRRHNIPRRVAGGRAWTEAMQKLRTENDSLRHDAERWRALVGSARLEWMGCAGFHLTPIDPAGDPKKLANLEVAPKTGERLHFGMSFWSEFEVEHIQPADAFERRFLTAYADAIIARAEAKA